MSEVDDRTDPSRTLQEELAHWRRIAKSTANEARRWKQRYEELAAKPDPGTTYLQEQLRLAHEKLRSSSATRSRAVAANRKSSAFVFGMRMRGRWKTLEDVMSYGVGEGDDVKACAADGWHYIDRLLRNHAASGSGAAARRSTG